MFQYSAPHGVVNRKQNRYILLLNMLPVWKEKLEAFPDRIPRQTFPPGSPKLGHLSDPVCVLCRSEHDVLCNTHTPGAEA